MEIEKNYLMDAITGAEAGFELDLLPGKGFFGSEEEYQAARLAITHPCDRRRHWQEEVEGTASQKKVERKKRKMKKKLAGDRNRLVSKWRSKFEKKTVAEALLQTVPRTKVQRKNRKKTLRKMKAKIQLLEILEKECLN
jgi:hypothetical protein